MAVGDLWEITLRQSFLDQECLNVFGYEETEALDPVLTPTDVAGWFRSVFEAPLEAALSTGWSATQIDIRQVTGGVTIGDIAQTTWVGSYSGTATPSSVAFGFRLNRASGASRHGYKRFVGCCQEQMSGNTYTASATLMNNIAAALLANVDDPAGITDGILRPRIISRILAGQPRPVPLAFPIASVTFIGITTQNTRKPE